jgi:glutathione peroxidase
LDFHSFSMAGTDGAPRSFETYRGRVVLVVNVASRCGYTPQYTGLESLYRAHAARGFSVAAVPCNQFGAQEPGTNEDIHAFCRTRYDVTFDLFAKSDVNGPAAHPLFTWLTAASGGPVAWNFTKFLVGKDGRLLERFEPSVGPDSRRLLQALEAALA